MTSELRDGLDLDVGSGDPQGPKPRARCEDCGKAWFGRTIAHGLQVLGHCPRCNGSVSFSEDPSPASAPARAKAPQFTTRSGDAQLQPWQVLGLPNSWDL